MWHNDTIASAGILQYAIAYERHRRQHTQTLTQYFNFSLFITWMEAKTYYMSAIQGLLWCGWANVYVRLFVKLVRLLIWLALCVWVLLAAKSSFLRWLALVQTACTNNNWSQLFDKSFYRIYQNGKIYVLDMCVYRVVSMSMSTFARMSPRCTQRCVTSAGLALCRNQNEI